MSYGKNIADLIIVSQLKHHFIASATKMWDFSNSWTFFYQCVVLIGTGRVLATRIEKRLEPAEKPAVIFQVFFTTFELACIGICLAFNLMGNVN